MSPQNHYTYLERADLSSHSGLLALEEVMTEEGLPPLVTIALLSAVGTLAQRLQDAKELIRTLREDLDDAGECLEKLKKEKEISAKRDVFVLYK
jgi:hypothetical protein